MRRKLLTAVLCMSSLAVLAQSQLVVKTTNGSTEKYALEQNPEVRFYAASGTTWVYVGDKAKKLDIESLHLENVPDDSKLKVLIDIDGTKVLVPITDLKSIVTASYQEDANHLPKIIADDPAVSIYNEALKATHMTDSLLRYMDVTYGFNEYDKRDSCYWNSDKLVQQVATEYENLAFPEKRYYKYTALLVPDAVLKEKYGITSLDDLRAKAHELYDPMYPEDKGVTDETDRRNALNRFISYHLLPFYGGYYTLTAFDNGRLQNNFNRTKADITDWYETMMPHSLMKFSFPSGADEGLYVNRRGVQSREDDRGVFVRGAMVTKNMPVKNDPQWGAVQINIAENGIYHYIDDIVAYDQQMQQVVCNDRMRIDCTTLSPDFMTSGARGHGTRVAADGGMYGEASNSTKASQNPNTCLAFKPGFIENIELPKTWGDAEDGSEAYGLVTSIHVRNRYLYFWSYQGDEVYVRGERFDVKIKLPTLPAGKYELRLGTVVNFATNGHLNLYIDDTLVGDNVDFSSSPSTLCGWLSDAQLGSEEAIASHDKTMREKGWMKGAGEYTPGGNGSSMRDLNNTLRRVIGTFETDGKTDHYLRLQQQDSFLIGNLGRAGGTTPQLPLDYIELIPVSLIETENIY